MRVTGGIHDPRWGGGRESRDGEVHWWWDEKAMKGGREPVSLGEDVRKGGRGRGLMERDGMKRMDLAERR